MNNSLLKPITELSYLNAQNVGRYRCIMRYFYDQHQRLRYWLRARDIYLKAQQEERALLLDFLEKERIIIRELSPVSAKTRYFLLYWIGRCLANKSRQAFTPEG